MEIKIIIDKETNKVDLESSEPIRVDDLMTVLFTVQLSMLREATPSEDDPNYKVIRDLLYDNFNVGASTVLSMYAPDNTLRPDLTAEAMLEAENNYMEGQISLFDEKNKTHDPEEKPDEPVCSEENSTTAQDAEAN